jgi:hypothetical protein
LVVNIYNKGVQIKIGGRQMKKRILIVLVAVACVMVTASQTAWATGSSGTVTVAPDCPVYTEAGYSDNLADIVSALQAQVDAGAVSLDDADQTACDPQASVANAQWTPVEGQPSRPVDSTTGGVDPLTGETADYDGCAHWRKSADFFWEFNNLEGITLGEYHTGLTWCWNGKTVSHWSGYCDGHATTYGKVIGISWDGCVNNDYVQRTWRNHYPGEITHQDQGKFGEDYVGWPTLTSPMIHITGHADGTCSHRYDQGTIEPWC